MKDTPKIDIAAARELLDFGRRIGPGQRADEQLQGAVALHNILSERGVAYLADEVRMGKTYVALGALALFRHYKPDFRVLVMAPRQNIQRKWIKEVRNFVSHNVVFEDCRVKGIDEQSARDLVFCDNLIGLVRETAINPDRDVFVRLTSFCLPVGGDDARTCMKVMSNLDCVRPASTRPKSAIARKLLTPRAERTYELLFDE